MRDEELRAWAKSKHVPGYSLLAVGILRLLAEKADLQKQVDGHVARIAAQSELLGLSAGKEPWPLHRKAAEHAVRRAIRQGEDSLIDSVAAAMDMVAHLARKRADATEPILSL